MSEYPRVVESIASDIMRSVPGSYYAAIRRLAYVVTERLNGFPASAKGLGWEAGVVMVLADMIDNDFLRKYQHDYYLTEETAEEVAVRLIELCMENPRELA
ncbi:hypothetical protein [Nonomuraea typhae]|uniref:Uncharacterized protein n=1 Tax=Nonomuraea typhae TaxID=2603600 RepID=A0ABW7YJA8_9ACTN